MKLELIWSMAYQAMRDARRIVMIGVSVAPSDSRLRWLIREAAAESKPNLVVVNPDERDRLAALKLFGFHTEEQALRSGRYRLHKQFSSDMCASLSDG